MVKRVSTAYVPRNVLDFVNVEQGIVDTMADYDNELLAEEADKEEVNEGERRTVLAPKRITAGQVLTQKKGS